MMGTFKRKNYLAELSVPYAYSPQPSNAFDACFASKLRWFLASYSIHVVASGGFRGGMWGMHPPHQPKSNDFGRKISLYLE